MALVVLDASVVIAFLDARDPKHEAALAVVATLAGDTLVLPASAFAEVLVGAFRRDRTAAAEVERFISDAGIRIEPLTPDIARRAAELRARHRSLRLADALVLATGEHIEARMIVTADRAWRGLVARVRVI